MTTGKTIALTRWTFVGRVMSLLFNVLFRLVITFFQGGRGQKIKTVSRHSKDLAFILGNEEPLEIT